MIKYKNTRTLTMTFFSSLLLLTGCNKEEDSKEHLQKGVEYFNKGDYDKALLELKTSNQTDKTVADTHYYLAMLDEKNHQYKTMVENLKRTLELEPTRAEARLKLGKIQLLLGDTESALEQAEMLLKEKSDNAEALLLKASIFVKQKKQADAKIIVDNVLKNEPNQVDALLLNSVIYGENEKFDEAFSSINAAIKLDEKNISLRMFKIQLDAKNKNIDAVIEDYKELVVFNPDNQDYKITLARIYAQTGKKKEAEDILNDLMAKNPDKIQLKILFLEFLKVVDVDRVKKQLEQFVSQYSKDTKALFSFADWMASQRNFDESKNVLNKIIQLDKKDDVVLAKIQLAKIAFMQKDFETSKKISDEILSQNPNYIDAKILQARLFLVNANYDDAITLLSKILWEKSNSEETLILLGQTYAAKGDKKQAEKQFLNVIEFRPNNLQALTYLYDSAVETKDLSYAKQLIEKALLIEPDNLILLEKLVKVDLLASEWNEARETLQRIGDNVNPQAQRLKNYLEAQLFQAQNEYAKAIVLYKKLVTEIPDNYDVLANLLKCYESLNKKSEMIALLDNLLLKNSQNVSASIILSNLWISDKKFDKANALLQSLIDSNNKSPELYEMQAKGKLAQGDNKLAISIYKAGLKQNPGNLKLLFPLARLYEVVGDYDSSVTTYKTLLEIDSNFELAINNLASVLTEHYNSDDKLNEAVKLSERFKDSKQPYYKDTYAWAVIKQGDLVTGIQLLKQIITTAPNVAVFRYHLGVAYHKNKNNGAAIAELKQSIELSEKYGDFSDEKTAKALFDEIQKEYR